MTNPHKAKPQTSEDRDWATGIWNPKICSICELRTTHPVHQEKYLKHPELYKLEHLHKQ